MMILSGRGACWVRIMRLAYHGAHDRTSARCQTRQLSASRTSHPQASPIICKRR
ncbi:hypothetical protein [Pseudochelatococcus contaminans]|uniref:Uncharacterized protein n=1 Tax=Pseudochelatococcus contaminans TaxID=1538103 RepID=A0A7W6EGS5_9HYPH|nr:hypothetical protein [Pseudochelatococcus contaminans]MBB3809227.1 hypothetical protein [Pseudochelatococcus contaminans]